MDQINERLKEMRLNAGMSQEELASKLNVSRQSVSKWETGDSLPDILKLKQLSKLYDVSIDYIVGNTEFDRKEDTQKTSEQAVLKKQKAKRALKGVLWGTACMLAVFGMEVLKQDGWVIAIFAAVPMHFLINYYVDNKE